MANDLAYVVQAVVSFLSLTFKDPGPNELESKAPNFVWKTSAFPRAAKGYSWSIGLQALLSKSL